MRWWLDLITLEVFFKLSDSMIPFKDMVWWYGADRLMAGLDDLGLSNLSDSMTLWFYIIKQGHVINFLFTPTCHICCQHCHCSAARALLRRSDLQESSISEWCPSHGELLLLHTYRSVAAGAQQLGVSLLLQSAARLLSAECDLNHSVG